MLNNVISFEQPGPSLLLQFRNNSVLINKVFDGIQELEAN